ncbi:conserved hypothetical protein [Pyrenophora tritici-repentis Pt-1C-BFP]|uniref:DUF2461 domain containing protein n=1 Tax=Pyrenophora tritici-repentis (strain Pt-1C-BFP) TaxID=426418 RepID=B2W6A8_PYRTR|nr:uncharacterized protein PTRG_05346 [Pyrenophora tritici-repentis Pt-1C-BFP]EDU48266.1 conserved hypothetical protein [Pyrenophora tritici-repentis Pt-1C-BFP]
MPRKTTKSVNASAPRSTSKRPAPETRARESKRARATARKSYVEPETDTDDSGDGAKKGVQPDETEDNGEASDYEEHVDKDASSESERDENASDEDSETEQVKPKGSAVKKIPIYKKHADEKELWKPGAKLEPGTQLVIKKPKARDAGDTPYLDHTIHPNTMLFLKDLAANNDRQWLKLHDPDFRASFQDFTTFTEKVSEKIIEADETIPELPVKDVTYFSAAWSRTGRKGPYAHYYIQVQPNGGSFVGGGFWQPDAATLAKLRRDIDRKPHKIKTMLRNAGIRKHFLGGVADDDKKVVKAFTNIPMNKSNALKRNPKGYDHDHKDIDLLRLRNFTVGRKLEDDKVVGTGGLSRIAELVLCLEPFITYLNSVVMPDEDTSGSSSGEDDESDAERDKDSGDDAEA